MAVAANFILPFEQLSRAFEKKRSIKVKATFSSTGNLYAQIRNGAPYDLFLAADEARPHLLQKSGLAEKPFVYAKGKVVLWSSKPALCKAGDWQALVRSRSVSTLAIANPETAPYGTASVAALRQMNLWETVEAKLVYAQTIAQAFQYAHSGAADAGFCALSSLFSAQGKNGCHWVIPEAPEVIQAACVLKRSGGMADVQALAAFLGSAEARAIKSRYGYE